MTVITHVRCDRCGNEHDRFGGFLTIEFTNGAGYLQPRDGESRLDLCMICEQDFVQWLRNEQPEMTDAEARQHSAVEEMFRERP